MRIPRIYHPEPLISNSHIALCEDAANHIGRVLRMGPGQALQLFDGSNQVFDAEITSASKKAWKLTCWKVSSTIVNRLCIFISVR